MRYVSEQIEKHINNRIERDIKWYRPLTKATAIRYAEMGLSVIPMKPRKKSSYIRWKRYQETPATPLEVRAFFGRFPDAQIGIVTGSVSNLVVVDFDGEGVKEKFEAEFCQLPDTIMQTKGRTDGGSHYLFPYPPEGIRNTNSKIFKQVDIKGEGGCFVLAPSIHKSGRHYRLINFDPFEDDLSSRAELPEEIREWWRDY